MKPRKEVRNAGTCDVVGKTLGIEKVKNVCEGGKERPNIGFSLRMDSMAIITVNLQLSFIFLPSQFHEKFNLISSLFEVESSATVHKIVLLVIIITESLMEVKMMRFFQTNKPENVVGTVKLNY